jgi:hypothetical protein
MGAAYQQMYLYDFGILSVTLHTIYVCVCVCVHIHIYICQRVNKIQALFGGIKYIT